MKPGSGGRTVLIASGAYVEPELEVEFGRIPPAFLPLGNGRLFVRQSEALRGIADRIILSLPEDYQPDETDQRLLDALGIETVFVPIGLSLGNSIVTVMNLTAVTAGGSFCILHGDTLLRDLDFTLTDAISVDAAAPPGYRWGFAALADGKAVPVDGSPDPAAAATQPVLSGWFSFSDPIRLVQGIVRKGGNFLQGIADYAAVKPLQPLTAGEWFDFGHPGTFYASRRRMSTAREFNRLSFERRLVIKSGSKPAKIAAEAHWFENLPPEMRLFTPAYLGTRQDDGFSYAIEYLNLPTLADLFVFGRLSRQAWERIFRACDEFLTACAASPAPDMPVAAASARALYQDKTLARLEEFAGAQGIDLSAPCRFNGENLPSLLEIARLMMAALPDPEPQHLTLVHGDFCFSNILYDHRSDRVRVIDPRGHDASGTMTPYGDRRYDVGKLHHSVVGRYDHIIAGYYRLQRHGSLDFTLTVPDGPVLRGVAQSFLAHDFTGLSTRLTAPSISVLLFLSMLPLHADDPQRQMALLANALRLFQSIDRATPTV